MTALQLQLLLLLLPPRPPGEWGGHRRGASLPGPGAGVAGGIFTMELTKKEK